MEGDPPAPIEERYAAAVDVLVALHGQTPARARCRSRRSVQHTLPRYDLDAMLIEAELLLDWYLPRLGASDLRGDPRGLSWRCGARRCRRVIEADLTWVLRDFHSPNLLWLPERQGIARVGLLDFQDAVIGPAAYDLASLLQDARVDVPELMEVALLGRYVQHAARRPTRISIRRPSSRPTPRWRRSAPRRSSASSRGSTAATASRNTCVTCRGYGPICSARWRIRRWRRCSAWYSVHVPKLRRSS